MLEIGTKAPLFALEDQEGRTVALSDFLGKRVVLYFYPKDSTPGCTRQACAFAGAYALFGQKNAVVIGVSRDSVASHKRFAEKNGLPFILLSDPERTAGMERALAGGKDRSAAELICRFAAGEIK